MDAGVVEIRMQLFRDACKRRGLKVTPQRTEVFREVARSEEHPDAETVLRRVRKRIPNISLDTVYRILYRLEDEGLISRVQLSSARLRFDGNSGIHHHLVCSKCGQIADFESVEVENVPVPDAFKSWGKINGRHLQLLGVCRKCLRGSKSKTS